MKELEKKYLEELFIEYAKVNTRSDATKNSLFQRHQDKRS